MVWLVFMQAAPWLGMLWELVLTCLALIDEMFPDVALIDEADDDDPRKCVGIGNGGCNRIIECDQHQATSNTTGTSNCQLSAQNMKGVMRDNGFGICFHQKEWRSEFRCRLAIDGTCNVKSLKLQQQKID